MFLGVLVYGELDCQYPACLDTFALTCAQLGTQCKTKSDIILIESVTGESTRHSLCSRLMAKDLLADDLVGPIMVPRYQCASETLPVGY